MQLIVFGKALIFILPARLKSLSDKAWIGSHWQFLTNLGSNYKGMQRDAKGHIQNDLIWFKFSVSKLERAASNYQSYLPVAVVKDMQLILNYQVKKSLELLIHAKPDGSTLPFDLEEKIKTKALIIGLVEHHKKAALSLALTDYMAKWCPIDYSKSAYIELAKNSNDELIRYFAQNILSANTCEKCIFSILCRFVGYQQRNLVFSSKDEFLPTFVGALIHRLSKAFVNDEGYGVWLGSLSSEQTMCFLKGRKFPNAIAEYLVLNSQKEKAEKAQSYAIKIERKEFYIDGLSPSSIYSKKIIEELKSLNYKDNVKITDVASNTEYFSKDTLYGDFAMRSRLEAKYAALFDRLRLNWQFEPQRFKTDLGWYLPDFYIDSLGCYIEIKPSRPSLEELSKIVKVANAKKCPVVLLVGFPETDPSCDGLGKCMIYVFWPNKSDVYVGELSNWLWQFDKRVKGLIWRAINFISEKNWKPILPTEKNVLQALKINPRFRYTINKFANCNRAERLGVSINMSKNEVEVACLAKRLFNKWTPSKAKFGPSGIQRYELPRDI